MLEFIRSIFETASFFGVVRLLSTCTSTDIVFIFLCSKPIFVLAAIGAGIRAHLQDGGDLQLPDYYRQPPKLPGRRVADDSQDD